MKQLTCEMCGSTDLVKQDGFFVCQTCGCKYSGEEAKKMMIEGTVEITGTVKIDHSEEIQSLFKLARQSYERKDFVKSLISYEKILEAFPENWEALYYCAYIKFIDGGGYNETCHCSIIEALYASLRQVLLLLKKETEENRYNILKKIEADLHTFVTEKFGVLQRYESICDKRTCTDMLINFMTGVIDEYGEKSYKNYLLNTCKYSLSLLTNECIRLGYEKKYWQPAIDELGVKIKKYDPNYDIPQMPEKKSGCYVATCVYGSYDCPEVWTLRRYRDDTLGATWYGRAFIKFYYAISPTLVKWFGKTKWFKKMWKGTLDRMVKKLNDKGIEDTPYKDKNWK